MRPVYNCDCDLVVEMEESNIGVGEILQYVRGALSRDSAQLLRDGLDQILASPPIALPSIEQPTASVRG